MEHIFLCMCICVHSLYQCALVYTYIYLHMHHYFNTGVKCTWKWDARSHILGNITCSHVSVFNMTMLYFLKKSHKERK